MLFFRYNAGSGLALLQNSLAPPTVVGAFGGRPLDITSEGKPVFGRAASVVLSAMYVAVRSMQNLPRHLDWILSVVERLLALGVSAVIFYIGFLFVRGSAGSAEERLVAKIGENWKAILLLLLIPLFYRTVRTFLEEVQEAFGMRRRPIPGKPDPEETRPLRGTPEDSSDRES